MVSIIVIQCITYLNFGNFAKSIGIIFVLDCKTYCIYRYQENLKTHAIRVMGIVEKVMHRLDEEMRAAQVKLNFNL